MRGSPVILEQVVISQIPPGLVASDLYGTQGMQTVDVQLLSNEAWLAIRVFTRSMNLFGYKLFFSSGNILFISVFKQVWC